MLAIGPSTVMTPEEAIAHGMVLVSGDRILAVGEAGRVRIPPGCETLEPRKGSTIVPGFIDLQVNGARGIDLTATPERILEVASALPFHGVTSFLPTFISSDEATIERALESLRGRASESDDVAALPLGLHLEGPYLHPEKKGAHDDESFLVPEEDPSPSWLEAPEIRMVTLAPELPGALEMIRQLASLGVVVAAGHSRATLEEAHRAFAAGVRCGTHLFNAMSGLHHRDPGLAAALLMTDGILTGLIADGVHVHPGVVVLALRLKTPRELFLVSDAVAAAGMQKGRCTVGGEDVIVGERSVRLPDGTLAGSALFLDTGLRNLVSWTGRSLLDLLPCVTTTPATLLGIDRGRLAKGCPADLTLLDPDLAVTGCVVRGRVAFWRK